jgi:hypothetical protein
MGDIKTKMQHSTFSGTQQVQVSRRQCSLVLRQELQTSHISLSCRKIQSRETEECQ